MLRMRWMTDNEGRLAARWEEVRDLRGTQGKIAPSGLRAPISSFELQVSGTVPIPGVEPATTSVGALDQPHSAPVEEGLAPCFGRSARVIRL